MVFSVEQKVDVIEGANVIASLPSLSISRPAVVAADDVDDVIHGQWRNVRNLNIHYIIRLKLRVAS